jgi:hypothetical protein
VRALHPRAALALAALLLWLALPTASRAADAVLFDGSEVASIIYDPTGAAPLDKAAGLLAHDLTALTGHAPAVSRRLDGLKGAAVVIGRRDAPLVARLLAANHIDSKPLAGQWETYGRAVVPAPWNPKQSVLVIFGSDVRGTVWGVVDLTREMGVSPWEWWADVKIRPVERIAVDGAPRFSHEPSVKYRGVFLNDEDFGLFPWASKSYDPAQHDIGPKTYARVYELMWRLKANTLWPAMHAITTPFNQISGNPETADAWAIVHATSHAEPMLRNNVREWDEKTRGPFNYTTNKSSLLAYWDQRVRESKDYENIYTVGLRGIHDSPMVGADTPQAQAEVLKDVVAEQRRMLARHFGRPASEIPQSFTAYKEVLGAYDAGLKLPDDITITWPDDNYGYIRRLSDSEERKRSGGAGVYYHISYWGSPMSYLWLATTHPALMWEEMDKAYRFDARRIWILNVGDLKPGEYLTQLFLDIAFDEGSFPNADAVRAHLDRWAATNFGPEHGPEIAAMMRRYYDLAFERRPEFMGWSRTYPTTGVHETAYDSFDFGDETERRLDAYRDLSQTAARVGGALPTDRRDAFYELVEYPIDASAGINERVLDLDKAIAYGLERRAGADLYAERAAAAETSLVEGARRYNEDVVGGKWRGMMDIAPHRLPLYSAPAVPAWTGPTDPTCAVQTEGGAFYEGGGSTPDLSPFHRELPQTRYVDVFVKSPAEVKWSAAADAPWIKLSQSAGVFSPKTKSFEQRIEVSIDWASAPRQGAGVITVHCDGTKPELPIGVRIAPPYRVDAGEFIEVDRHVSMYATHANSVSAGWETLNGLGHTGASLRTRLDMASVNAADPAAVLAAPSAGYVFETRTGDDPASVSVFCLPTLPITSENRMRIAVSVDGAQPQVFDLAAAEFSETWKENVLTNAAVARLGNLRLAPGRHTLKVYALDPGVILDRIEVAFAGAHAAYGPVPETRVVQPAP